MLKRKFQTLAQVVGCVTMGLLAVYGLLTLLGGGPAMASALDTVRAAGAAPVIPATFNYQGLLRNPDGSLVTGVYTITAKIYNVVTGGTALYHETFPSVTARDGLFNVVLGDNPQGQNLAGVFSDVPRYIGITLNNQSELIPRQRLHAVPWALIATNAMTATTLIPNATVNGLTANGVTVDSSELALLDGAHFMGTIFTGRVYAYSMGGYTANCYGGIGTNDYSTCRTSEAEVATAFPTNVSCVAKNLQVSGVNGGLVTILQFTLRVNGNDTLSCNAISGSCNSGSATYTIPAGSVLSV